jgi:hypothetical protein
MLRFYITLAAAGTVMLLATIWFSPPCQPTGWTIGGAAIGGCR